MPTAICSGRQKSDKGYMVNRDIKAVDFYLCLKNETHLIHNYIKQLDYLFQLCKCRKNTFYERLQKCVELELITIEGNYNIRLASWSKFRQIFLIGGEDFHTVQYDLTKPKANVQYILKYLEIRENEERQRYAVSKELAVNPEIKLAYERLYRSMGVQAPQFSLQSLQSVKRRIFEQGTERSLYEILQSINPSLSRNVKTIAKAHGYKNWQGAAYLKYQLVERGLVEIIKPTPAKCLYKFNKRSDITKRGISLFGRFYNRELKVATWYQPDEIVPNPAVFSSPAEASSSLQNPKPQAA